MKKNKKIDSIKKVDYQKQEDVLDFIDFLYGFFTSEFNLSSSIFPSGIKIDEVKGPKQNEPASNFQKLAKTYNYAGKDLKDTNDLLYGWSQDIDKFIFKEYPTKKENPCCSSIFEIEKIRQEQEVAKVCSKVLSWGGVQTGAFDFLNLLAESKLIEHLKKSKNYFDSGIEDLESFQKLTDDKMNASWSKVYSLTCNIPFVIFDSRVSAALQFLAGIFLIEKGSDEIPSCLQFPALESRTDRPRLFECSNFKFKLASDKPKQHAIWNLRANWIIEAVLGKMSKFCDYNQSNNKQKFCFARSIEAGLFRLGYDLNILKKQVKDEFKKHLYI